MYYLFLDFCFNVFFLHSWPLFFLFFSCQLTFKKIRCAPPLHHHRAPWCFFLSLSSGVGKSELWVKKSLSKNKNKLTSDCTLAPEETSLCELSGQKSRTETLIF
ncbi:hypothetical protein ILYODFUR_038835 [Ilyodon furcidens]|uniref:Secreted protein n=1 Tax=Ilyodon furcidens TaxID=33524 RepID=A0ABV0UNS4_9TELE